MATLIVPVLLSLFLGPGVGQLYNKEYKKGAILIGVSALILVIAGVWYYKAVQEFIPADITAVADPQAMQQLITNATAQVNAKAGMSLLLFKAVLMALWIYGAVDAYFVADKKRRI